LPFAVGVYLPLSTSTPILAGGLLRWVVDRRNRSTAGPHASDTESEMSPGVLLSTGFIAGGTIAGVIVAFLSFSDSITNRLAQWQYRQIPVSQAATLDGQIHEAALNDLGLDAESAKERAADVDARAGEIRELNKSELPYYVIVPAGARLKLPDDTSAVVEKQTLLSDVAKDLLGTSGEASRLLELNDTQLTLPKRLPGGTLLKVPQRTWPAIAMFSALAVVLLFAGIWQTRGVQRVAV
jgi:hypothetical protein